MYGLKQALIAWNVITQLLYPHIEAYYTPIEILSLLSFNFSLDLWILGSFRSFNTAHRNWFVSRTFLNFAL